MCVFMGNLSSKTLKSHISSMTYDLKFLPLWERASIRCLLMQVLHKSNCKFLPRWFRYGLSWSFLLLYLPTFSESNAWDFHPVMTGISGNVLATSDDFRRLSEDFRTLPKMSADVPKAFEHFRSYLKDSSFRVLWFRKNTKKTQSHHLTPFRIEFSLFIMCERTICRDLSVRREKLFFQGEIDVFSPQLSRIMHESWQEYNNLKV